MGQDGDKSIEKDMERDVEQKFDIILADPPYDKFDITEVDLLTKLLKHGGIMALSHPEVKSEATEVAPTLTGAELIKSKKYAGARLSIYQCS